MCLGTRGTGGWAGQVWPNPVQRGICAFYCDEAFAPLSLLTKKRNPSGGCESRGPGDMIYGLEGFEVRVVLSYDVVEGIEVDVMCCRDVLIECLDS